MFLRRSRVTVALAAALAFSAVLAACGSDGGSGGGDSDTIKIGNWVSVSGSGFDFIAPQVKAGAEAAISSINATGGINGRNLELSFCDQKFDPNQEVTCARQMVSDNVSAVVAPSVFFGAGSIPILERAKIPVLASQGLSPNVEYTCATCYPLGGSYGWYWGVDYALLKAGATKFSILGVTNATSVEASNIALAGLEAAGITDVPTINADGNATDLAPQASQAMANGVDGIVLTVSPQLQTKAIAALRDGGYTGKIGTITDLLSQDAIDGLGSKADGVVLSSLVSFPNDEANPGVTEFQADMAKYAPDAVTDTLGLEAWAAVKLFATIAKSTDSYDAAGILEAIKNTDLTDAEAPVFGGFVIKGATSPVPDMPQLLITNAQIGEVVKGVPTAQGPLLNVVDALNNWNSSN